MKATLLTLYLTLLVTAGAIAQQTMTVTGRVLDDAGEPLIGASVVVKDANKGVVTNVEGRYSIPGVKEGDVLVFNYIGTQPVEMTVAKSNVIDVRLNMSVDLEEVVSVGYGHMRKVDYGGAISTFKAENIEETASMSINEVLMGKLSGVNIVSNTGEPGAGVTFNIRGSSSLSGNSMPLYVIDGQPFDNSYDASTGSVGIEEVTSRAGSDPLASINPNDILSIDMLKDASSTAIYGSRGANGVIMITTKSGQEGRTKINYNFRLDVKSAFKKLDVLSTDEYYEYLYAVDLTQLEYEPDYNPTYKSYDAMVTAREKFQDVNWQDLIFETTVSQDHQLQISGGRKGEKFMISGGYTENKGIVMNSLFKRGSIRANYSRDINDRLKFDLRSGYTYTWRNQIPSSSPQGNFSSSAAFGMIAFKPNLNAEINLEDLGDEAEEADGLGSNPLFMRKYVPDKTDVSTIYYNMMLTYNLSKGLDFSVRGTYDRSDVDRNQYWPRGTWQGNTHDGSATFNRNKTTRYSVVYMLNYMRTFKRKHRVTGMVGYEWSERFRNEMAQTSRGFADDELSYHNLGSAKYPGPVVSNYNTSKLSSFMGRFVYSYNNRYSLTFTSRLDGSSRLAPGRKWTYFPAGSAAWNISNEDFMKCMRSVSQLKLRTSYGVTGNESISVGASAHTYGANPVVMGQEKLTNPLVTSSIANPYLTWERTYQMDAGVDVGFFDQRLTLTVDLYNKLTKGLLINNSIPTSSGYGSYPTNVGQVRNRGIDIDLSGQLVRTKKTLLQLTGVASFNRSLVMDLGGEAALFGRGMISHGGYNLSQSVNIAQEGEIPGAFYGYKTAGVYQTWDQVLAGPEAATAHPGNVIFVDTNGDGIISEMDKTVIGNPHPDMTYGITLDFNYKRLSFMANFMGSVGNEVLNLNRWPMGTLNKRSGTNVFRDAWENRWQGPGTGNNIIPSAHNNELILKKRLPDWMVEDGSYFRFQQVRLSYTFTLPKSFVITDLKVFASMTNIYTWTKYTGFDPMVNTFGDIALTPGIDFGTLPAPRTVSFGINITL